MSYNYPFDRESWPRPAYGGYTEAIDLGLRRYLLQVYNVMPAGLALTGLVAYAAVATGFYQAVAGTPLIWLVILAPLGAVLFLSFRSERLSAGALSRLHQPFRHAAAARRPAAPVSAAQADGKKERTS